MSTRTGTLLILFLFYQNAIACSFGWKDIDERYRLSKGIYIGYAVGVSYDGYEEQIIKDDLFYERKRWRIYPKITYKIRVKETLKGDKKDEIRFIHSTCSNGRADILKQRAIIYRYETHDFAMLLNKELYDQVTANKKRNEMDGSDEPPIR